MSDPLQPAPRPSRGIYLLPNLFTTGGLFAGFYAIIAASADDYVNACIAVFVAGLLDGLDGRIARLTGTQSEFGVQYDSLAYLVSFGMAPALVMAMPKAAAARVKLACTDGMALPEARTYPEATLATSGDAQPVPHVLSRLTR